MKPIANNRIAIVTYTTVRIITLPSGERVPQDFGQFPVTPGALQEKVHKYEVYTYPPQPSAAYVLSVIDDSLTTLLYSTFFSKAFITNLHYVNDHLYVSGSMRYNHSGYPEGKFICRFSEDFKKVEKFKVFAEAETDLRDMVKQYNILWNRADHREFYSYVDEETGDITLIGTTDADSLAVTDNALQKERKGVTDLCFIRLNKDFETKLVTYIGGEADEICKGINIIDKDKFLVNGFSNSEEYDFNFRDQSCLEFIHTYDLSTLSVTEEKTFSGKVFPNPAEDYISIPAEELGESIEIYNILGEPLLQFTQSERINISSLPAGVYTLRTNGKAYRFVKK